MKKFLQVLFFFLLVTQICFGQGYQQNREANPNIKNSQLDQQDKHYPIIDRSIQVNASHEFPTSKIPDKFRIGIDTLDVNGVSHPFSNNRLYPNGYKTSASPRDRMYFLQSQIYVIDTAIVISELDTTRHLYSFNTSAKMTTNLIQRFGGGIWVDTERSTYTYDANNNMLSFLVKSCENDYGYQETYTYDANNNMLSFLYDYWRNDQWMHQLQGTYTYDANNNMLSFMYEEWNNGQLDKRYRYMFTYDTSNNMLSYLNEYWEDGQWVLSYRCTHTYDAYNNMLSELREYWLNGQWVYNNRETFTYDENNNMLSESREYWLNGQWVYDNRETFTYDANNNMLSKLREDWLNDQWVFNEYSYRYSYTYDANNNMLSYLHEYWDTGQWVYFRRETYTYDTNNNILSVLHEDWGYGQFYRETYAYDTNNNKLSSMFETMEDGQWLYDSWVTCSYDANNNMISVWHHEWLDSSWIPMDGCGGPGGGFCIDDIGGNKYCYSRWYNITFIRKLIVTDIESKKSEVPENYTLAQNYPNPFNPTTTIKYSIPKLSFVTIRIYDVLGSEVAALVNEEEPVGTYELNWNAANLPSGVYFYQVRASNYTETKKMLLLR